MTRTELLILGLLMVLPMPDSAPAQTSRPAPPPHQAAAQRFAAREADWRAGGVIYQVFVDRFAPSTALDAKRKLYAPPRRLRPWDEAPTRGKYDAEARVWTHELDFWGGDLASLRGKLDYIAGLGVDAVYLNPIFAARTNHKYDTEDYFTVSPEYGTQADLRSLIEDLHQRELRLVLDGVFNHMGRSAPWFKEAEADPKSRYRDWFDFGDQHPAGYRAWANALNLPELNLENPAVRAKIYADRDSVVQHYLRMGIDGWRLDVAYEIGTDFLSELTRAAHATRPDSVVIGEIWTYPAYWFPAVDGLLNMHVRQLTLELTDGHLSGPQMGRMLDALVADAGLEPLLRCWLVLDNHDTPRIATRMPDEDRRRCAEVLQFTLPGTVCLYYGTELGVAGGEDPQNRALLPWDRVSESNDTYAWYRKLLTLRRECRALRVGDFQSLATRDLLAFQRTTDRAAETVVVVVNPTDEAVEEALQIRDGRLLSYTGLRDALSDAKFTSHSGVVRVSVPKRAAMILRVDHQPGASYDSYKRIP